MHRDNTADEAAHEDANTGRSFNFVLVAIAVVTAQTNESKAPTVSPD